MKAFFRNRSHARFCCLLGGLLLASWLTPAAHGDGWPLWPFKKEEKPGKPDKVVGIWSDTVLTKPGSPATRGFGGRLMFYEGKSEEPIKVEGTLVVYAFDETNRDANNNRPDRKYVFTPEQLPAHYSKSKVGHTYSVWVPWDEIGGMQKEFTLIIRFQPKEGPAVVSDPVRQILPGRIPPPAADKGYAGGMLIPTGMQHGVGNWNNGMAGAGMPPGGVQPAAYQATVTDSAVQPQWQERRLTTATIDVPSGSTIRSAIAAPQVAPGGYQPTAEAARQNPNPNYPSYPAQSYPPRNYPQNYQPQQNYQPPQTYRPNYPPQNLPPAASAPQPGPSASSQGLQLRAGFAPGRQWPLGEPLARLNRDRAPSQPLPAGSPSALASPPGQGPANAAPVGPQGAPQYQN
jgi:hypothetical protein